jgi:hypothetical protein
MSTAGWRVALASAIGTSHIGEGVPCQDSSAQTFIVSKTETVLAAVVCDGAGSAECAEIGARKAAQTFLSLVSTYFEAETTASSITREIAVEWVSEITAALREEALNCDRDFKAYACTLLAAIVGESCAVFIQIGDGAIVVSEGVEDGWSWVFWPQHGEFANTTNFLTSQNALVVMEFASTAVRIDEIALFSDGIENLVLHHASKTVHQPFFESIFTPIRKSNPGFNEALSQRLGEYLMSPLICERTNDDKSLILASRRPLQLRTRDEYGAEN